MELLQPAKEGSFLDATFGGGGHTRELLKRIGSKGSVIAMDRDSDALQRGSRKISDPRVHPLCSRFSEMTQKLIEDGHERFDGIIMDLGVSMLQLRAEERGFSFHSDAPLDMRMDDGIRVTAGDIVNRWREKEIERILREYGEERKASRIAKAIVTQRSRESIKTCTQLAQLIERVYRKRGRLHPATKTFQALRIEVNDELNELDKGLRHCPNVLQKGGRLCVISYNSLEDRIVKRFFLSCEKEGVLRRLVKKPLVPSQDEIRRNPSSRSAKLRGAEKI
jgi:16S rRNA (cytosine1402-N4)-methyltransferase